MGYTNGKEDGRYTLQTAGSPEKLRVTPDKTALTADGRGAAFLTVELTDAAGILSPWESCRVTVSVEGAAHLAGLGSADPQAEGSYQADTWPTFDGRLLAVVRAGTEPGPVQVRITAEGCDEVVLSLECR